MSELLTLQREFAAALRQPERVPAMLARLIGPASRNADLLSIYRANSVSNARAALRLAYPVCAEVLGEECFSLLARRYWQAVPATEGDLNLYGGSMPAFIAGQEDLVSLPWLADLALLEWALHEAGMAPDHAPRSFVELATLSPDSLASLRLGFQPALRLIPSAWPIASLWLQHQPAWRAEHGEVFRLDDCGPENALIHRTGWRPAVLALPPAQARLLAALLAGEALATALVAASAEDPAFQAEHALYELFSCGLVTALIPGDAP